MPNSRSEGISYISTNVIVPKHFIDVEIQSASSELFTRGAQCAADLLQWSSKPL